MTDITFVAGAYLVGMGALVVYAATLVRRLRAARLARAAMDRQDPTETIEAATQLQAR